MTFDEDSMGATHVFDPDDPIMGLKWSINVSESDTREMTAVEVAFEYQRGTLDVNDVYVWRDGMADWIALGQCSELMQAISQYGSQQGSAPAPAGGYAAQQAAQPAAAQPAAAGYQQPAAAAEYQQPAAAAGYQQPATAAGYQQPTAAAGYQQPTASDYQQPAVTAQPAAAAQPAANKPQPDPNDPKLFGERNEASMLFSVDAIMGKGGPPLSPLPGAASASDDDPFGLKGLTSGGLGAPPVHAPANLAPPPVHTPAPVAAPAAAPAVAAQGGAMPQAPTKKKGSKAWIGGVVVLFLLMGGAAGAFVTMRSSSTAPESDTETKATDRDKAADTDKQDGDDADGDDDASAKAEDGGDDDPSTDASATAADSSPTPKTNKSTTSSSKNATSKKENPKSTTSKDSAKTDKKEDKKEDKPEPKAEKPKDDTPKEAGPFSRDAARSALNRSAGAASGCARSGGPTGRGRASVTFSPSGGVAGVNVSAPFAGTSVGSCISGAFRSARVPPFTGSSVTFPKSFYIK